MIKSRRMRWEGHVEGRRETYTQFRWENLKATDHLKNLAQDTDKAMKLQDSIKCGKFLTYLGSYYIVKRDHALWG